MEEEEVGERDAVTGRDLGAMRMARAPEAVWEQSQT